MKVWVVLQCVDYVGEYIHCIYASLEAAETEKKRLLDLPYHKRHFDNVAIEEHEVIQ